jgi:hypothetical protein
MKVQIVIPYRVSHLQRYGITVCGNVKGVYPPLNILHINTHITQHSTCNKEKSGHMFTHYVIFHTEKYTTLFWELLSGG